MNKKVLVAVFAVVCALVSGAQTIYYRDSSGRHTGTVPLKIGEVNERTI